MESIPFFAGRISRKTLWIGAIIIVIVGIGLGFALILAGFADGSQTVSATQRNGGAVVETTTVNYSLNALGTLIVQLVTGIPLLILGVRRRHDRDNPGYDALAIWALGLVVTELKLAGLTSITGILDIAVFAGGVYLIVVLGFLAGTPGPNRYGPDPRGSGA